MNTAADTITTTTSASQSGPVSRLVFHDAT